MNSAYPAPSAETAIEEAREVWQRGYRDAQAAGREIPVVDVPRELGDVARTSVEATDGLARLANRRSYTVSVDLAGMERRQREQAERAAQARQRAQQDAQYERAAATRRAGKRRARRRGRGR